MYNVKVIRHSRKFSKKKLGYSWYYNFSSIHPKDKIVILSKKREMEMGLHLVGDSPNMEDESWVSKMENPNGDGLEDMDSLKEKFGSPKWRFGDG